VAVAVTLTPEAFAALLGAGIGAIGAWSLALLTQIVRDSRAARRERKIAALLVLTEITRSAAALGALRGAGVVLPPLPVPPQTIWEANGRALLYGASVERAGTIERAYSSVGEVGSLLADPGRDFTEGSDAALVDQALEEVFRAMRLVIQLAGLPAAEADRRIALMCDHLR
jgi:hypothetical protein